MFANRRMFWNVRPIPAWTISLGFALRKTPARRSSRTYQRGPDDGGEEHRGQGEDRDRAAERGDLGAEFVTANASAVSRPTTIGGTTQMTGSSQARTGRPIIRLPGDLDVARRSGRGCRR